MGKEKKENGITVERAKEISSSDCFFKNYIDKAEDCIVFLDKKANIIFINHAVEKITGRKINALMSGKIKPVQIIHSDDYERVMRNISNAVNNKKIINELVFKILHKEGAIAFVCLSAEPVYNGRTYVGTKIIIKDCTDKLISNQKIVEQNDNISNSDEYKLFFEVSGYPMLIIQNGNYTHVNYAAVNYLGFDKLSDIIGKRPVDLAVPEQYDGSNSAEKAKYYIDTAMKTGNIKFEWNHLHKSGKVLWTEVTITVLPEDKNKLYTIWKDINETKNSIKALEKSDKLYKEAEKIAKFGHWELDLLNNKLTWSDEIYILFGLEPNEFEPNYQDFLNYIHPDDRKYVNDSFTNSLRTKIPYDIVHRLKLASGEIKYVNEKCRTEYDTNGAPLKSFGTVMDITKTYIDNLIVRKLSRAIDQSPVSIIITDSAGKVEYVNPKTCETSGYSADELIGKNPLLLKPNNIPPFPYDKLWENANSKKDWHGVLPNKKKNGELYWENVSVSPVLDNNGNISNFIAIKEDITERKNIQDLLKKNEERFRQVTEQSLTVISEIGLDGKFAYISPVAKKIFGYEAKELENKYHIFDILPVEEKEDFKNKILSYIQKGEIFKDLQCWMKTKNGTLIWTISNGFPIYNNNNIITGYRCSTNNITQRKLAVDELKIFKSATDRASYGISINTLEGKIVYINDAFAEMHGHKAKLLIGERISIFHTEEQMELVNNLSELLLKKGKFSYKEVWHIRKDGAVFPTLMSGTMIYNEKNIPVLMSYSIIDISTNKQNELLIKHQNEQLKAIINAIPDMMFVISDQFIFVDFYVADFSVLAMRKEQIIGSNIEIIFGSPEVDFHKQKISECLLRNQLVTYEYSLTIDNNKFYFEARIAPMDNNQVLAFIRDITRKKESELELRKLYLAIEESPVITVITDLDANIEYVNKSFEKITGYTFEEVKGKNTNILDSAQTPKEVFEDLWKTLKKGDIWRGEWLNKKKNGEFYWEDVAVAPIKDEKGNVINYLAEKQDITLRKNAEKEILELNAGLEQKIIERTSQLKEVNDFLTKEMDKRIRANEALELSETRLEMAMLAGKMAWWEMDVNSGNLIFHSRKAEMLGYPPEILKNYKDFMKLVHLDDFDRTIEAMSNHLNGMTDRYECEYRIKNSKDKYIWFQDVGKISERTQNGKPLKVVGFVTDISNRKIIEDSLALKTKELEIFFTVALDLLCIVDSEGNFIKLNKAWSNLLGYNSEYFEKKKYIDFVHTEDKEKTLEIIKKSSESSPVIGFINRYIDSEGTYHFIEWNSVPVGKYHYAAARDITKRIKIEEELIQARETAEKANKAKSEFLSRMSHELRTPMNSILGFAQLLEMANMNEKQKRGVGHILSSGKHLLGMINEVLDISRIEAGRLSLSIERINLAGIIKESIDIIEPLANSFLVKLFTDDIESNDIWIKADYQRFKQIMLNILNNAIKYNKPNGSVTLKAEIRKTVNDITKNIVVLSIADTGIGISSENLEKIFIPFERLSADNSDIEGTGLGLSVVKRLSELMGIEIRVESILGTGTTFFIELPVYDDNNENYDEVKDYEDYNANYSLLYGTVIYIEDNPANVELIELVLKNNCPSVKLINTSNGSEAGKLIKLHKPDIILLDLNLPDIDGEDVLVKLKKDDETRNIPVIVISADATESKFKALRTAGAANYLTKPVDLLLFLNLIYDILPKHKERSDG